MYVNDLTSGEVNVQRAASLKGSADFSFHKWNSNVPELETKQCTDEDLSYAKQQLETV